MEKNCRIFRSWATTEDIDFHFQWVWTRVVYSSRENCCSIDLAIEDHDLGMRTQCARVQKR